MLSLILALKLAFTLTLILPLILNICLNTYLIVHPNTKLKTKIYMWKCKKHNCSDYPTNIYIGLSSRKFQFRFSEHIGYIKSDKFTEPSGEHFNLPGHSLHDIEGLVLEKFRSSNPFVIRARETILIQNYYCYRNGLNKEP